MNERIVTRNFQEDLAIALSECEHEGVFVVADENTAVHCWPVVKDFLCLRKAHLLTIPAGDEQKTIATATHVWEQLSQLGATRHSCLINLGGGMVTDLGGFAASTFKRGLRFINIPTTLLAMVDASVGGKTGFNFGGLKNEVGVFSDARSVIIATRFLHTMDRQNLLSGYAEMLKHGLIGRHADVRQDSSAASGDEAMWAELLTFDIESPDLDVLSRMIRDSVDVKERIVMADPTEQGLRKALNLGHTIGHALESLALTTKPVLHGYAVAWGLVCELYLSCIKCGFPVSQMRQTVSFITQHYGRMAITCDDYPTLLSLMSHDKKNLAAGEINFTLLGGIGDVRINQTATRQEIEEALDFFREG